MKKIISLLICVCLCVSLAPAVFAENSMMEPRRITLKVDGTGSTVRAFDASYDFNTYISLRDLAAALSGTGKQFFIDFGHTEADGDYFEVKTGQPGKAVEAAGEAEDTETGSGEDEALFLALSPNRLFIDGRESRYYTYRYGDPPDLYMSLTDVQLVFDIQIRCSNESVLTVRTSDSFSVELSDLEKDSYFTQFASVLAGEAGSGEIVFGYRENEKVPVASTSKLMTYLLAAEAMESGRVSADDTVTFSDYAIRYSKAEDGRLDMENTVSAPFGELIEAMLIVSSNEAAIAVAEHICGTESACVKAMNKRAAELGMDDTVFYNCSGLPVMTFSSVSGKIQNSMSAKDMFTLVSYILEHYPQITGITSKQLVKLESFDYTCWNSNTLVFNVSTITGLKTGSTNASGSCVVACDDEGRVVIVFGAENSAARGRCAELVYRFAPWKEEPAANGSNNADGSGML